MLRADLLRYLILWYYGGFYADLDVYPARTIKGCPSLEHIFPHSDFPPPAPNVSFVVGVELDEPYFSRRLVNEWNWSRRYGFIQWTMYAPRRFSPILRMVIVRVLAHIKRHYEIHGFHRRFVTLSGKLAIGVNSIFEITGPTVVTDSILDTLSSTLPPSHPLIAASVEADKQWGDLPYPRVSWAPFHHLSEPVWVDATEAREGQAEELGGLGILPINVWGNGQSHSGAENSFSKQACINHHFKGSWKKWWWEKWIHGKNS